MSDKQNMGGKYVVKKKDPLQAFYPIIGLIVLVIGGAIGYFVAPYAIDFARPYLPPEVMQRPPEQIQLLFTIMIALIIVAVLGFMFAIFAPKPPKEVSEKALMADRRAIDMERRRQKQRRAAMRQRMKKGTKNIDDV